MDLLQLKGNLKKEYNCHYTNKKKFIEYYQGNCIPEFIDLPKVVYTEWRYWKNEYNRRMFKPVEKDTFDKYFQEFKDFWQYGSLETQQVFREMELLSNRLLNEWRIKYTFTSVHIYESCINRDYMSKTKAQLWEEFKKIWDLDPEDYSEHLLEEYLEIINKNEDDSYENYFNEYPRNFWEFRENANYHSYSILEKYQICQEWEDHVEYNSSTD